MLVSNSAEVEFIFKIISHEAIFIPFLPLVQKREVDAKFNQIVKGIFARPQSRSKPVGCYKSQCDHVSDQSNLLFLVGLYFIVVNITRQPSNLMGWSTCAESVRNFA